MAGLLNQKIFIVKISCKKKLSGAVCPDFYLASRTFFLSDVATDAPSNIQAYGILREIDGFGQAMGEVIADDKFGSLTIDVTRGSTEQDKRFYDRFEEDTILHQACILYSLEVPENSLTGGGASQTMASWNIEFSGEISKVNIDPANKTANFAVKSKGFPEESPNYFLTRNNFASIKDDGNGKFLPLVFGRAEVVPSFFRTFDVNSASGSDYKIRMLDFMLASSFYNSDANKSFVNGSVLNRYAQNSEGGYSTLSLPYSATGNQNDLNVLLSISGNAGITDGVTVLADDLLKISDAQNFILTYSEVFPYLTALATSSIPVKPTFKMSIYERSIGGQVPNKSPIGEGNSTFAADDISSLPTIGTSYPFSLFPTIPICFNDPVFLWKNTGYFFSPGVADQTVDPTFYLWGLAILSLTSNVQSKLESSGVWSIIPFASQKIWAFFYALGRIGTLDTISPYTYERLGSVVFSNGIYNAPLVQIEVNQSPSDCSKLNLIYEMEGLKTQSTFLTGTSGQLITRADHIVKFLYYLSNNYSLTGLDLTTFNPGNYAPNMQGATEGRKSYREILLEILENAACKLVPRRGTNSLALWAYGVVQASAATITESDCTLESIELEGLDAIINRIKVSFDRSMLPLNDASQQQGQSNFKQSLETSHPISVSIYGKKDLSSDFIELQYIKDPVVAARWAEYKLAQYARERMFITFTVPFWKNNYRAIDLMDIIDFSHIDNPSYFGSASSQKEKPITTDGINIDTDFNLGEVWRRAKQYKMRILVRTPRYSINAEEATIQFKAIVLDNPDEIY